jgi:hypothetical protein
VRRVLRRRAAAGVVDRARGALEVSPGRDTLRAGE